MSCRARWFPRPRSTQALAPTPGCTRCGISSEVSSSRGEPTRSAGGGGHGPSVTSPTPASASTPMASPRWWAIISSMLTPQRSAAARTLPALVPTTRSASASGHGRRSCRAGSAPVIQAAPSTPPAPSTRPTRGRDPPGAGRPRAPPTRRGQAHRGRPPRTRGPGRPHGARGGGGRPAPRPRRADCTSLCPRRGGGAADGQHAGGIGAEIEYRRHQAGAADAIHHAVVHLREQRPAAALDALQEPRLPQRPVPISR